MRGAQAFALYAPSPCVDLRSSIFPESLSYYSPNYGVVACAGNCAPPLKPGATESYWLSAVFDVA